MQIAEQRVDIIIEWPEGKRVRCPECGKLCALKDRRDTRSWRHLDIMQFQTFLHCPVPRAECRTHGARTIDVPWSTPHSRWTLLHEAFAVLVMEQVPALTKSATILKHSWDEVFALRKRAVERGLLRREVEEVEYLGIDEKSFGKKERFITVLSDLTGERVLEVVPSKSSESARTALAVVPEAEAPWSKGRGDGYECLVREGLS